ncbi:probable serine hydrolase [Fopius arisanus]|uniref:Probable serine hydrolase n=1 Tax=Fopius arisanus TaxID=64838 RepID=A0A9R1T0G5_9HYME|nr:PREDICTED: probable serine hydrolase [Fopius arisanus]
MKMGRLVAIRKIGFRLTRLQRNMATAEAVIQEKKFKEVEIEVPWGKIAGKHWGPPDVEPIVALHGWQDNAGSFDNLIKYLPNNLSILAVDAPGHGYSSWLPKGTMYTPLMYIQVIQRVKQHYKMDKIGLIAHSMGAMWCFSYAVFAPQDIKFVIALDYFKFPELPPEKFLSYFFEDWNRFFRLDQLTNPPPRHSEAEAISRYIKATNNSLDEEMCRILFERGTTKHPDGTVSFNRDPYVQCVFDPGLNNEQMVAMAKRLTCPYYVIKGESSRYKEKKELYFEVLKVLETTSSDFMFRTVPGTHHFHMKNTSHLADLINPFIQQHI